MWRRGRSRRRACSPPARRPSSSDGRPCSSACGATAGPGAAGCRRRTRRARCRAGIPAAAGFAPCARSLVPLVRGHLAVPRVLVTRADLVVLLGRELILGRLRTGGLRALIRLLLLAFDGALEAFLLLWVHAAYLPGDTLPRTGRWGADRGRVGALRRG